MTTQADLKAEMASDLFRADLTDIIASKITNAVRFYNRERFYWNTLDAEEFDMVVGQSRYTVADAAFIPNIVRLDALFLILPDKTCELERIPPAKIERLLGGTPSNGEPCMFAYESQSLRFYLPPKDTYLVRIHGQIAVAGPATDVEADNPWMNDGYELIKQRALSKVYGESLHDTQMAQVHTGLEAVELNSIVGETNMRSGTGELASTDF